MTQLDILPTFQSSSFEFEGEIPEHIENVPNIPNYIGLWAVFGFNTSKTYPLAHDIVTEDLAMTIAEARERQQELSIETYGYSDSVYILHPDGSTEYVYCGHTSD
ncbi:MAG: hypothetical protein Q7T74_03980 [Candidatus Saccharibacteria bacterium]|nr:hypothetical protein [Candidatus Saccharibacteria bacterium]